VQAAPKTYATGPSAGTCANTSPFSSARSGPCSSIADGGSFALCRASTAAALAGAIDASRRSTASKSQSLDYVNDASINSSRTIRPSSTRHHGSVLNFQNSLTEHQLANGAGETVWDYGTTRATKLNGCNKSRRLSDSARDAERIFLRRSASHAEHADVAVFATANSLNNRQKDSVVSGDFIADPAREVPAATSSRRPAARLRSRSSLDHRGGLRIDDADRHDQRHADDHPSDERDRGEFPLLRRRGQQRRRRWRSLDAAANASRQQSGGPVDGFVELELAARGHA
jgi:hypothetical protein